MSDISRFEWWFRDRDYVLRERLAEVEYAAQAASARSNARLSSQLSRLQGSLEGRLNALSRAFDAYVELGDIREQLAGYGESAAIRREAMAAIAALGEGRPAKPVDDRGSDYWLAPATNAVIARCSGAPDEDAERRVRETSADAELFLVAASGALGLGQQVADRVPALLRPGGHDAEASDAAAGDNSAGADDGADARAGDASTAGLDERQLILFRAVADGVFGEALLQQLLDEWAPQLAVREPGDWWQWAYHQGSAVRRTTLDWIEWQGAGAPATPTTTAPTTTTTTTTATTTASTTADAPQAASADPAGGAAQPGGLRKVVLDLIQAGHGDERALLARARELRARIENPTGSERADDDNAPATPRTPIVDAVRSTFLQVPAGSPARAALWTAIAPSLLAAVEAETPRILHQDSSAVIVHLPGGRVPVSAAGPDQEALARARSVPPIEDPAASSRRLYGFGVAAAVVLLLALVLAITGVSVGVVILLLVAAVALGLLAGRVVLARRRLAAAQQEQSRRDDERIAEAMRSAQQTDAAQQAAVRDSAAQLDRIRAALS